MPVPPIQPPGQTTPQPQQAPGAAPQGGAPIGASQATQPTQNKGYEVAGQKMVGLALLILEQALPLAGAGTEQGKVIHKSIGDLAKLVPPGAVTPQDVQNVMQQLLLKQQQFGQQMQQMRQQQAPPQAGVQPGGAPPMARAA